MVPSERDRYDYVVDKEGNGDYESIQAAIDGAKSFPPDKITIFVKDGVYREKVKVHEWNPKVKIVGESEENTIISYGDHFDKIGRGRNSTFFTYTLKVCGNDFCARNLTVRNNAGRDVGQAIALHVESDRAVFDNCRFVGNQDTVYAAGEGSRQYFTDCYIEGTTDFIFGGATAVFENCDIHSKADSYITAASTPQSEPFGYVFKDCVLTGDPEVSEVYLGRPWRNYAHVAFIRSHMGAHVHPAGWHNWSRPEAEETVVYAEYNNSGPGAAETAERVPWSKELTASEAENYTKSNILMKQNSRQSTQHWYQDTMG